MTTATDPDVQVSNDDTGEVYPSQVRARIASLDGAATEAEPVDVHGLAEALARQTAQTDMLAAENAELRRRLGGWEPRRDPSTITGASDLTQRQHDAGLYRPAELDDVDDEGMPLHAIGNSGTWPTWLDEVHLHQSRSAEIEAEFHAIVARHTAETRSTVWDDELRALYAECEPVTTDWWEREERLMVGLVTREQQSVYGELAPDKIAQDSPADESGQNREATSPTTPERASGRGSGAETSQSPLNGPEDRQPSPPGASEVVGSTQRRKTLAPLATEPVGASEQSEPPRVGGWRTWAKSVGLGAVLFGAMIAAVVVLA